MKRMVAAIILLWVSIWLPGIAQVGAGTASGDLQTAEYPEKAYLPLVMQDPADMVYVSPQGFQMGCDPEHNGGYFDCSQADELPLHTVYLDSYWIDKHEVTNAAYARCVAAGACSQPAQSGSETRTSYYDTPGYRDYPVIFVSWQQASTYCTWAGKRLPTEAEWEKAARGTTIIAFPWGDEPPVCVLANFYDYWHLDDYCIGDTARAGSYPAGASDYGALDMAGNVWEWVNDWYQADYYSVSPPENPSGPAAGTLKLVRGGSWLSSDSLLRTAYRGEADPARQENYIGFRCAVSPRR